VLRCSRTYVVVPIFLIAFELGVLNMQDDVKQCTIHSLSARDRPVRPALPVRRLEQRPRTALRSPFFTFLHGLCGEERRLMFVRSRSEGGWIGEWRCGLWFRESAGCQSLSRHAWLFWSAHVLCVGQLMGVVCVGLGSPNLGLSDESRKNNWF
jgi:hypothetical protein